LVVPKSIPIVNLRLCGSVLFPGSDICSNAISPIDLFFL
jgi:hypothetical protein